MLTYTLEDSVLSHLTNFVVFPSSWPYNRFMYSVTPHRFFEEFLSFLL